MGHMDLTIWESRTFAFDYAHLCRLTCLVLLVSEVLRDHSLDHRLLGFPKVEVFKSRLVCAILESAIPISRSLERLTTGIKLSEVGNVKLR